MFHFCLKITLKGKWLQSASFILRNATNGEKGDIDQKTLESQKRYIKNLSDSELTRDQFNILSRGLKVIPMPVTNGSHIRLQLSNDFKAVARRMRLQYMFHGQNKEPHPHYVKSIWEPPIQPSVALKHIQKRTKHNWQRSKYLGRETTCFTGNVKLLKSLNKTQILISKRQIKEPQLSS